jgi:hypothetical protein
VRTLAAPPIIWRTCVRMDENSEPSFTMGNHGSIVSRSSRQVSGLGVNIHTSMPNNRYPPGATPRENPFHGGISEVSR